MDFNNDIIKNDLVEIIHSMPCYKKMKNGTVLITGANGMLATYMVYTLMHLNDRKSYNIKVIALVRNGGKAEERFHSLLQRKDFRLIVHDVCEPWPMEESLDYIIHAAGNSSPRSIITDPVGIIAANTIGTFNILELAKAKKIKSLLFTSTREVYGEMAGKVDRIKESDSGIIDPLDVRSCYPESKRISETLCKSYQLQYGVPFKIVRIAHCYGPGMKIRNDGRVMADLIGDVVAGRNVVLKSDGSDERGFCYINDAITAMFLVMLDGRDTEAYNLANETEVLSVREVAQMLVHLFPEKKLSIVFDKSKDHIGMGYSKIRRVPLDTTKLHELGWYPRVKLEDGLKRTVNSFGDWEYE